MNLSGWDSDLSAIHGRLWPRHATCNNRYLRVFSTHVQFPRLGAARDSK